MQTTQTQNQHDAEFTTAVMVTLIFSSAGAFIGRNAIRQTAARVAAVASAAAADAVTAATAFAAANPITTAVIVGAATAFVVAKGGAYARDQYYAYCNQQELDAINVQLQIINQQNAILQVLLNEKTFSVAQLQQQKARLTAELNALTNQIGYVQNQNATLVQQCIALQQRVIQLQTVVNALGAHQANPAQVLQAA